MNDKPPTTIRVVYVNQNVEPSIVRDVVNVEHNGNIVWLIHFSKGAKMLINFDHVLRIEPVEILDKISPEMPKVFSSDE